MTTKSTTEHTPRLAISYSLTHLTIHHDGVERVTRANSLITIPCSAENVAWAKIIAAAPETAAERDRLREENASLQEALEEVIKEVSWFVARKKNLAEIVAAEILVGADGVKVWANVLDEDLDIARAALARHAKAEGRS